MAWIKDQGSLLWRGDLGTVGGNESRSFINNIKGVSAFGVFVTAIEPYSEANLSAYFLVRSYSQTAGAPGTGANVKNKAIIYFRDPDTLIVDHFCYPAPIAADIEDVGYGKRIKQSSVVSSVGLLSYVTDVVYVPLYGVYMERV